jgi:hypothetical protein
MTAREIYDLATHGGSNDFQIVTELLEHLSEPWCLIGGIAVNVYCSPVYTAGADFVVFASQLEFVCAELAGLGFAISHHRSSVNAHLPDSDLVVQFTTDPRYQDFLIRATLAEALGVQCRVAALPDLFQGKLWAASDPERRLIKRSKDELDLVRIADTYPEYLPLLPEALRSRLS